MRGCKPLQTTSWLPPGKQGVFLEDFEVFPYVVAPQDYIRRKRGKTERVSQSRVYNQNQAPFSPGLAKLYIKKTRRIWKQTAFVLHLWCELPLLQRDAGTVCLLGIYTPLLCASKPNIHAQQIPLLETKFLSWWSVGVTWDVFIFLAGKKQISFTSCSRYVTIKSASQYHLLLDKNIYPRFYKAANEAKSGHMWWEDATLHGWERSSIAVIAVPTTRVWTVSDLCIISYLPWSSPSLKHKAFKKNPEGRQAPHAGNLSGLAGDCKCIVLWKCLPTKGFHLGYKWVAPLAPLAPLAEVA